MTCASAAVIVSCSISLCLGVGAPNVSAQEIAKRYISVTVTDPNNRFVTGLQKEHFEVIEGGVSRAVTEFSDAGSPISIAIVSDRTTDAAFDDLEMFLLQP